MKILLKDNESFGGFIGKLVNDNLTSVGLPPPFNVTHTGYAGQDKKRIINQCGKDAKIIFNMKGLEVIDITA